MFHGHSKDLKEVDEAYSQIEVIQTDGTVVAPVPPSLRPFRVVAMPYPDFVYIFCCILV